MESATRVVAPRGAEVPMVEPEVVRQMRELRRQGWGAKRIARELEVARNTVRRYLRGGTDAERQQRPRARRLDEAARQEAARLFDGAAEGNAVVARRLLADTGVHASLRTVQREVAPRRRARRAAQLATVRYETAPGHQMQVDFGQKQVRIGGRMVLVYLLVAVLSFSRRLFVRAFLAQRQDDWREGLASAFRHFGGVTQTMLIDNAGALVVGRERDTGHARLHPGFAAFCRDWDVAARVCQPYRARTKGKTESGVKYVKRNALAGREFESFAQLEVHLGQWMAEADGRVHGTTREVPRERFERAERQQLRPLPSTALPVRERRLRRRVSNDCFVELDTVRYSVPHRLVGEMVEVLVGEDVVRVSHGGEVVATHRRVGEPHAQVREPSHFDGLWRREPPEVDAPDEAPPSALASLGRSLADYAAVIEGGAP